MKAGGGLQPEKGRWLESAGVRPSQGRFVSMPGLSAPGARRLGAAAGRPKASPGGRDKWYSWPSAPKRSIHRATGIMRRTLAASPHSDKWRSAAGSTRILRASIRAKPSPGASADCRSRLRHHQRPAASPRTRSRAKQASISAMSAKITASALAPTASTAGRRAAATNCAKRSRIARSQAREGAPADCKRKLPGAGSRKRRMKTRDEGGSPGRRMSAKPTACSARKRRTFASKPGFWILALPICSECSRKLIAYPRTVRGPGRLQRKRHPAGSG